MNRKERKRTCFCSEKKKKENPCIWAALPLHSPSAMGRQKKWPPIKAAIYSMYQALASISGDDQIFRTTLESIICHFTTLGNGDTREAGAITESPLPYLRYRWRDRDTREALATRESTMPNLRY